MRKLRWVAGLLFAVGVLCPAGASRADQNQSQSIEGNAAPLKVPKDRFVTMKHWRVTTETHDPDSPQPSAANRAVIDFDDDIHFNTFSVPLAKVNKRNTGGECPVETIAGVSTAEARAVCKAAIVGKGTGTGNILGTPIPSTVTAFAGPPHGRRPVLLLHSDPGFDAFVLISELYDSPLGGDYGKRLDVQIPPLTGGAAIEYFDTDIFIVYRYKGDKYSLVTGRCGDKNRTWNFRGQFFFDDNSFSKTDTDSLRCKVRKR